MKKKSTPMTRNQEAQKRVVSLDPEMKASKSTIMVDINLKSAKEKFALIAMGDVHSKSATEGNGHGPETGNDNGSVCEDENIRDAIDKLLK